MGGEGVKIRREKYQGGVQKTNESCRCHLTCLRRRWRMAVWMDPIVVVDVEGTGQASSHLTADAKISGGYTPSLKRLQGTGAMVRHEHAQI